MAKHVCPWWLAYTFDNPMRALLHKPELLFAPYVRAGMTVADIGCGMGFFALGLARLVGAGGKVLAVDLQQEMLNKTAQRAVKQGLRPIIRPSRCRADDIGIAGPIDFALAFWMAHEIPDPENFFAQVHAALKPGGLLFFTEPKFHVSEPEYRRELELAVQAGFGVKEEVLVKLSHAAVLEKPLGRARQ